MFKMSEAAAFSALVAGTSLYAPAAKADTSCALVTLAYTSPKAAAIKDMFKNVSGLTIEAIGDSMLSVCGDAAKLPVAKEAIARLSGERPESSQMRLFFHRDATGLAKALNQKIGGIEVSSPDNSDLLVFKASPSDDGNVRELKRVITLLDAPRPEITVNAWSVQISAARQETVVKSANTVRQVVYRYNQELQEALRRGWSHLHPEETGKESKSAPALARYFAPYVLARYAYAGKGKPGCTETREGAYWYCLGYEGAFSDTVQPSLANMIGILAGFADPNLNSFVDQLEDGKHQREQANVAVSSTTSKQSPTCDELDEEYYRSTKKYGPHFACFREQLNSSLRSKSLQLARLRTAMADFLFQYKFSVEYPHDFDSYDYAASAQHLDIELDPLLVAFNHDLVIYLRDLQHELTEMDKDARALGYSENGIVTVRTISGTDSSVSTQSQSSFKTTPPPLVQDFLGQLGQSAGATTPGLLSKNLPPNAASALAAFLKSGQAASVTLARDLNLTVTPNTLPGASAAELKIILESKDDGTNSPQKVGPDGKAIGPDTADRVAVHTVTTNVRVDSLKLFEISTFSARLSRGRDPIPLIPPFVQLPYIPPLLSWRLGPSSAFHQSFAIVSATILPTAADLLNGLRFSLDRIPEANRVEVAKDISAKHRDMLKCIADSTLGKETGCDPSKAPQQGSESAEAAELRR